MTFLFTISIGLVAPATAQEPPLGLVRVESGGATLHRADGSEAMYLAVRLGRVWRDDHVRLDVGMIRGASDGGFSGADVGMELRACGTVCRVVPFVAVGLGGVQDRVGAAPMARLGFGLDVRLSAMHLVRLGVLLSVHGTRGAGPNGFVIGFTQRFGRG